MLQLFQNMAKIYYDGCLYLVIDTGDALKKQYYLLRYSKYCMSAILNSSLFITHMSSNKKICKHLHKITNLFLLIYILVC